MAVLFLSVSQSIQSKFAAAVIFPPASFGITPNLA